VIRGFSPALAGIFCLPLTTRSCGQTAPEPPRARLAILPGTSHIGIMAEAELIARLVKPFLDDAIQPMPPGFF
jgi:hypothetical protein